MGSMGICHARNLAVKSNNTNNNANFADEVGVVTCALTSRLRAAGREAEGKDRLEDRDEAALRVWHVIHIHLAAGQDSVKCIL